MSYFLFENHKIYYKVSGEGFPLIIIHGDTASSKMFLNEMRFYSKHFKVVLVDLIGQGKSQRIVRLPSNYWASNADMIIELCEHVGINKANLLGTSGGALVAINAVLKQSARFYRIIADSFVGESLSYESANDIANERKNTNIFAKLFWFSMHGSDWKRVIEQNTNYILEFAKKNGGLFNYDLSRINNNILLTGSAEDELIPNIENTLKGIAAKIKNSEVVIFNSGNHPAMFSNRKEFRKLVFDFFANQ